jgi:hypothetical protein
MRRSLLVLCSVFLFLFSGAKFGTAQAEPSAKGRSLTITAGGIASGFQSDDANDYLVGAGTFVDFHFSHWVQIEGEGRWLRWNQYFGEHEDNYLIGPRVPVWQVGKHGELYGKALIGYGKMTFPYGYGYGTFTALAFGGSLDFQASEKLTIRAVDFEYQDWPVWLNNSSLQPYGVSVGIGYRVF